MHNKIAQYSVNEFYAVWWRMERRQKCLKPYCSATYIKMLHCSKLSNIRMKKGIRICVVHFRECSTAQKYGNTDSKKGKEMLLTHYDQGMISVPKMEIEAFNLRNSFWKHGNIIYRIREIHVPDSSANAVQQCPRWKWRAAKALNPNLTHFSPMLLIFYTWARE